jgi:pyrimidine deaminase RibD-like protein
LEQAEWPPPTEKALLRDGILHLEQYSLQRWGQGLNLQTIEDLPRELCRLHDGLRCSIPGLGTYDDLDAAYATPLSEAVKILGSVRPFQIPTSSPTDADRYFMEVAIHEARQSVGEDGVADPKVGAVVARNGVVLASAHRGELKKGDHAEYIALERKLPNEELVGATVYTTLEPCTTRGPGKVPCAKRIIERKVARVLIGMLDPNPDIRGKGERLLRNHRIQVDRFPDDLIVRLEELNRDFTRLHE